MMKALQERLNTIVVNTPPSGISRFFDVASEVEGCISLGLGEPDFDTPAAVRQAGIDSIQAGHTTYTTSAGLLELRQLLARYYDERFGVHYDPSQIIVTTGASEGIDLAYRAIVNPGDEVLIPQPAYTSYVPCLGFAGGVCAPIVGTAQDGFKLTRASVERALSPQTKAILVPYPNNPTGAAMSRAELTDALAPILDTDAIVISDEIYAELSYGSEPHCAVASIPGFYERTLTLNGFSKAFAMTGWRLGYALGPQPIIDQMVKLHQITLLSCNYTAQDAGIAALKIGFSDGFASVASMRASYDERRQYLLGALNDMGLTCFEPMGAFYCFPSIRSTGLSSIDFSERLIHEGKVAVIPGSGFGEAGEGHVRISYAYSLEHLQECMRRMRAWLQANGWL